MFIDGHLVTFMDTARGQVHTEGQESCVPARTCRPIERWQISCGEAPAGSLLELQNRSELRADPIWNILTGWTVLSGECVGGFV